MARTTKPTLQGDLETWLRREGGRRTIERIELVTYNLVTRAVGSDPVLSIDVPDKPASDWFTSTGAELHEAAAGDAMPMSGGQGYLVRIFEPGQARSSARFVLPMEGSADAGDDMPALVGTDKGSVLQLQTLVGRLADQMIRMTSAVTAPMAAENERLQRRVQLLEAGRDEAITLRESLLTQRAERDAIRKEAAASEAGWDRLIGTVEQFAPAIIRQMPDGEKLLAEIGGNDVLGELVKELEKDPEKFEAMMAGIQMMPISKELQGKLARALNDHMEVIRKKNNNKAPPSSKGNRANAPPN